MVSDTEVGWLWVIISLNECLGSTIREWVVIDVVILLLMREEFGHFCVMHLSGKKNVNILMSS